MTSRRVVLARSAAIVGAASTGLLLPQIARAQGNKVRVGLMLPYTGTYAQLGVAIENGVRMAIDEKGGKLAMSEMHDYSMNKFFIQHQKFSEMMESLVNEGLVEFDWATHEASLTELGKEFISK